MKIDTGTLKRLAIELRVAIKEFVTKKQPGKLKLFASHYPKKDLETLLSMFDRYGNSVEYEKSGVRLSGNEFVCFKFGYTSTDAVSDPNSLFTKARMVKFNTVKKVKPSDSLVTYPPTSKIIDLLGVLYSMRIFNKSFKEACIYIKVKKLKPLMDKISEQGITEADQTQLNDIFEGLNEDQRNKVLSMFDCRNESINFKGIRYGKLGKTAYFAVDKNGALCKFKFNSLNLCRTVDVLTVWKQIVE